MKALRPYRKRTHFLMAVAVITVFMELNGIANAQIQEFDFGVIGDTSSPLNRALVRT